MIMYHPQDSPKAKRLKELIISRFSEAEITFETSLDACFAQKNCLGKTGDILLFFLENLSDLRVLTERKNELFDRRLVLLLPNREEETFSQGFTLYPRFTSDIECNYEDILEILQKLTTTNS